MSYLNKITLFILIGFYCSDANAQLKKPAKPDSVKTALVIVHVLNSKQEPRQGETLIFQPATSKKIYSAKTDATGNASLRLPSGFEYMIKFKMVSDTVLKGRLDIPAVGENEFYSNPFTINIVYEPARSFTLDNVLYDVGKATLKPASYKELNELFDYLQWKPQIVIEIAGHTDNIGKDEDNLKLSLQRSQSVKAYLVKKGIGLQRIQVQGYGPGQPIADNATAEGRQTNRRTEVRILSGVD